MSAVKFDQLIVNAAISAVASDLNHSVHLKHKF